MRPALIVKTLIRLTRKESSYVKTEEKPTYNKDKEFQIVVWDVVNCFGDKYDDRNPDAGEHISIREVSKVYKISLLKTLYIPTA